MKLRGIIPPVVTPFKDDHELDLKRLKAFIDWQIECGVHGIFVLGTTGEFYALDENEKQTVIATAVAHCRGRVAGLCRNRSGDDPRSSSAHQNGGEGRSERRVGHHALFPQADPGRTFEHFRRVAESTKQRRAVQQPGHVRRTVDRARDGRAARGDPRTSSASRTARATCRTPSRSSAVRRATSSAC